VDRSRSPRTVLGLTWRQHIGGRWAVSLLGFAITAPIAFITPFVNIQQVTAVNVGWWSASSLASFAVMGHSWWLLSVTVLRNRREHPVPIWVVVVIGFALGGIRSLVMTWITVETGLFEPAAPLMQLFIFRMLIGGAQGAIGLPVIAMCLSIIARYRSERARLLTRESAIWQQTQRERGASAALREALTGPVRARLQELADRLGDDADNIQSIAGDVREQAHELWSQARTIDSAPEMNVRDVLKIALRYRPLPLLAVWAIWVPSAYLSLALRGTLMLALLQTAVAAAVLTAIYAAGTWWVRRKPSLGPVLFLVGTVGGGLMSGRLIWWITGARSTEENFALFAGSIVWLVVITLMVSVVESAVRRSERVLEEIRAGIQQSEIELHAQQRIRADLAYEVASVLHGVVQGRLAVAQRAAADGNALARAALGDGVERLAAHDTLTAVGAAQLVREVVMPWTALLDIHVDADAGSVPAGRVRDVSDVIEECLSNTFRHGGATEVKVALRNEGDGWRIVLEDNGSGPQVGQLPGLGTSLFDAVSGGQWARTKGDDGGCRVEVFLRS